MATPKKPFSSDLVLDERISDTTLRAYHVGFEQNEFRLTPLVDIISEAIPEFALGPHVGTTVPITELRSRLREAARRVYTTEKYQSRGEFGEVILHLLLRDFFGSTPLISKIYFKDATNSTVHGFDGVHMVVEDNQKQLWLGESKIYTDGLAGVKELAGDLQKHIQRDYLRSEFSLICSKLPPTPEIDHWRQLLQEHRRLSEILDNICIPMVCTYESKLFQTHTDDSEPYKTQFLSECKNLHITFTSQKASTTVNVILLLLPVPSKQRLVALLDERLKHMQSI